MSKPGFFGENLLLPDNDIFNLLSRRFSGPSMDVPLFLAGTTSVCPQRYLIYDKKSLADQLTMQEFLLQLERDVDIVGPERMLDVIAIINTVMQYEYFVKHVGMITNLHIYGPPGD